MSEQVVNNYFYAWFLALRVKTLGAIFCPVMLANAVAIVEKKFSFLVFFLTLSCGLLLQILANLINDYSDFLKGGDSSERFGPKRVMQMGLLDASTMKKGIAINLILIALSGLPLIFIGGIKILLLGLAAIIFAFWYSVGPLSLSYLGFSEVIVFLLFGPVVSLGAYFMQAKSFSSTVLLLSFSPGFLSAALLLVNNLRDIKEDRSNNKKTIAVRFGELLSRYLIIFLVLASVVNLFIFVFSSNYSSWLLLSSIFVLPFLRTVKIINEPISSRFNLVLQSIGQSLLLMSVLLSLGVVCAAP